jgi:hypothetical protein
MTIKMKDPVTLNQFLVVAKEKGAHQQFIDRVPEYLGHDYVHEAIRDIAEFSQKPIEEVASKQVSHYLGLNNQEMPPLGLDLSPES